VFCATDPATCTFTGTRTVRFGLSTTANYIDASKTGSVWCDISSFGSTASDPAPGQTKHCWYADASATANPMAAENAKSAAQGVSTAWTISDAAYAGNGEIEGYASATSVNRGGSINLMVNVKDPVNDPTYTVSVYRVGWYGGAGGRLVLGPYSRTSATQPACPMVNAATKTIECSWSTSLTLSIPTSATDPTEGMSGIYLAKLTTSRGKSNYITFTVRDDARAGAFLFQQSVTTYAAYNTWGGYSFYTGPANDPSSTTYAASLNRPYRNSSNSIGALRSFKGAGDFLEWELHAVRFLERNGYDVLYSTNIDTHTNAARLRQFRGFLSVGHDEYWTKEIYDNVEAARNAGVNLAFLGANNAYWGTRLEPDAMGVANRRVVSYKYQQGLDPLIGTARATERWRMAPLNRPEASLIGVQYDYNTVDLDMVVFDCSSWICAGTGLQRGDRLPGLLGYEVDKVDVGSPANISVVMASPYVVSGQTRYAHLTYYTHTSGAGVFATGSNQWNWGLDAYAPFPERANVHAQTITRNVLDRFLASP
jgi:hypothetical protein